MAKSRWLFVLLLLVAVGFGAYAVWNPLSAPPSPTSPTSVATALPAGARNEPEAAPAVAAPEAPASDLERMPASTPEAAEPGFASVRVQVRWQHDGSVARDVGVFLYPKSGSVLFGRHATTDGDGLAQIDHIAPGAYRLSSTHTSESKAIDVAAGQQQQAELIAERSFTARGRVVDQDGVPVADASIYVFEGSWAHVIGRSGPDGTFVVPLRGGRYLAACKAGHVSSYGRSLHSLADLTVELVLRGKSGRVTGVVRDANGDAIACATVLVGPRGGHVVPGSSPDNHQTMPHATHLLTKRDGTFVTDSVAPGNSEVWAWASGFGPKHVRIDVRADADTPTEITLDRGAIVAGTMSDSDGKPVASAVVRFGDEFGNFPTARTTTNADGRFRLEDLPAEEVTLHAKKDSSTAKAVLVLTAGATTEWNPVLGKGRTITGIVLGPDGAPFASAKVGVVHPSYQRVQRWSTPTADGRFELIDVGDRPIAVQVESGGACLAEVARVAPDSRDVVIRIGERDLPTSRIRGRIVDSTGRPVVGSVFLRRADLTTSISQRLDTSTGCFAFGPMPPRTYELSGFAEGLGNLTLGTFVLRPEQDLVLADTVLQPTGEAEFTVFDAAGKPADASHTSVRTTTTGLATAGCEIRDGKGRMSLLQPGRYHIEVGLKNRQMARAEFEVRSGVTTQVEVRGRESVQTEIRFVDLASANADLTVRIVVTAADQLVTVAGTYAGSSEPLSAVLFLPIGAYKLECTASDDRRVEATLQVRSLDDKPQLTIELPKR